MSMRNNAHHTPKARRISAARLLLMLCWIIAGLLIFAQALPTIRQALQKKAPAEILHSDQIYHSPSTKKEDFLLDINQATAENLDSLPGIGPAYAQAIVDYREYVSRFYFLEDLMNVKGIGEKRLQAIRPFLLEIWPPASSLP